MDKMISISEAGRLLGVTPRTLESDNLQRQKERLVEYCKNNQYNICHIYEEIASGLNDSRRELIKMFRCLDQVDLIVIEYEDRLARFGYKYLEEFAKMSEVTIKLVENKEKLEPNEEMVQDLVSIVTCFSAKIYGARGGKKVKKTLETIVNEVAIEELEKERQEEQSENNNESSANKCK